METPSEDVEAEEEEDEEEEEDDDDEAEEAEDKGGGLDGVVKRGPFVGLVIAGVGTVGLRGVEDEAEDEDEDDEKAN